MTIAGPPLTLFFLCVGFAYGQDCREKACQFYEKAMKEKDIASKVTYLRECVRHEPTFRGHMALGAAYVQNHDPTQALLNYERAYELGENRQQQGAAALRVGRLLVELKQGAQAIRWYKAALEHQEDTKARQELKELVSHQPEKPTSDSIRDLLLASDADTSLDGPEPTIDLRVQFALNDHKLNSEGRSQIEELGNALVHPSLHAKRFSVIGHTDKSGSRAHNNTLSMRRAQAVVDYLVARFHLDRSRFEVVGRGDREPLIAGDAEEDLRLNRRVEVRLLPRH